MKRNLAALLAAAAVLWIGPTARAQTAAVQTGNWSDPATWSAGLPAAGVQETIDNGFNVTVDSAGQTGGTVDVGSASGQSGALTLATGGDLAVSGGGLPSIRIGQAAGSTGTFTVTGGNATITGALNGGFAVGDLMVGDVGTGTMNMSGGTITPSDEIIIGASGNGTVNLSGGILSNSTTTGRSTLVGFNPGSSGALNVSGTGVLHPRFDLLVGFIAGSTASVSLSDTGSITSNFMFTNFDTVPGPGSTVTLTQTGGTYTANIAYVMGRGPGTTTLTHSGGLINVPVGNGDMVVSDGGGNTSTYNISGTATVTLAHDMIVGTAEGANGTINQTGGSITAANDLRVGADGVGTWNLGGGTVNAKNVFLGDFDSSNGAMTVSGGTLNLSGNLSVGGALASNAPPAPVGTQGQALDANGVFTVSGAAGDINVLGNLLANPGDNARFGGGGEHNDGSLVFDVLSNSGVSRIDVTGLADLTGATVDLNILGGTFAPGSSFDLITAASISGDYVQASGDVGHVNLSIVPGGNGQILRATLVPEPAAAMLLLSAISLVGCRAARKDAFVSVTKAS